MNQDKKGSTEQKQEAQQNKDAAVKPDPETLHTTDPQDNMEGPISSAMQGMKEVFDDDEPKKADS